MLDDSEKSGCNLTLEILKGCGYSCGDCTVDKSFAPLEITEEETKELLAMIDSFDNARYKKLELTIGATDLLSADNGLTSLKHPLIIELVKRYKFLAIPLVLLREEGLVELCSVVDEFLPTTQLIINVPVTFKNLHNVKFIDMIASRVMFIKAHLKVATFKRINLNINLMKDNAIDITPAKDIFVQQIKFPGIETAVEYGFGHSRKGFDDIMNVQRLARDIQLFSQVIHDQANTAFNRMLVPSNSDTIEIVYRDGDLYHLPVIQERFPIFNDCFKINKPWNAETIYLVKEEIYIDNLMAFSDHDICKDCCFLPKCSIGDVHSVMRITGINECLIDMKNRWDLNPLPTLGEYE